MIIFLVGFMGCGKSYVGRNLAPLLDFDYVDIDKYIEEKEALTISEIFEQKGEAYFREQENKFIKDLNTDTNLVVSTGGGAPCFNNNMQLMNEKGLTVYLNRSKALVIPRLLKGQYKRPLIAKLTQEELEQFYDERLESRKAFYEQANLHVGDANVEEIFEIVKKEL
jgi:shikimate kinase